MSDDINLTQDQEEFVLKNWDKLKLEDLTRQCFKDPTLDGRSKQGRAVKKFLASKKFVPKPGYLQRLPTVDLTDSQKKFIKDHLQKGSSALDMARDIFSDPTLPQLSKEHRAVDSYLKTLDANLIKKTKPSLLADDDYIPPKTVNGSIERVNKYSHSPIEKDKLSVVQKKGVEYLTNHLNSPRFLRTINNMTEQKDRDSFESEFIRQVWDKPDLTAEEINLYINLCGDYIMLFKLQEFIEVLQGKLRDLTDDVSGDAGVRLAKEVTIKMKEYDECLTRHKSLIADLAGKRSKRIEKSIQDNATVLAIIQAWKNEEERVHLIRMAQAKEEDIRDEIKRLETMEEWKARVLGIGLKEAIHGF